jgi:hypothetical protein
MASSDIVIVQPWFGALGHPGQSTLNTARSLGARKDVAYLISEPDDAELGRIADELGRFGQVERFTVPNASLRTGTALALLAILRHRSLYARAGTFLFLDGYLPLLAILWPPAALALPGSKRLGVVGLAGPERVSANGLARRGIERFLARDDVCLFLRTEELAQAWQAAFPGVPAGHIDTLPSLEIPDGSVVAPVAAAEGGCRFGVIGQVRPGKSLEWLVPLFSGHPEAGRLAIAGTFSVPAHRAALPVLAGYAHFDDRFLDEAGMLAAAAAQDYLVALYDDWDPRMEAATVYMAARVGKPVIVYDRGWCGRVVRTYGCGIATAQSPRPDAAFFRSVPQPGSTDYGRMQEGMVRFREAHGGASSRDLFLSKLRAG